MPVMDEFREEREALKNGTFKEKLSYFFYYYKWHVIVTLLAVVAVTSLAFQILNQRDTALYIALINAVDLSLTSGETPGPGFEEYAGIDTDSFDVAYDTTMRIDFAKMNEESISSAEKFVVYLAASELDVVISDEDIIRQYAHSETFSDLRSFLSPEQYEAFSPYFYYIDQAVIDAKNAAQEEYNYDFVPVYPDPKHPESMKEPIPVGIYLTDCPALTDRFFFTKTDSAPIISVVRNTTRPETVSEYLDFLMGVPARQ